MMFHADASHAGTAAVLRMAGDLNSDADAVLQAAHAEAVAGHPDHLELDFTDVSYINSSGIALLVAVLMSAREARRTISARGLSPHYRHIFEITRLSDYMDLDGDGTVARDDSARAGVRRTTHG